MQKITEEKGLILLGAIKGVLLNLLKVYDYYVYDVDDIVSEVILRVLSDNKVLEKVFIKNEVNYGLLYVVIKRVYWWMMNNKFDARGHERYYGDVFYEIREEEEYEEDKSFII